MYNSHNSLKQISADVKYTVSSALNLEDNKTTNKICRKINGEFKLNLLKQYSFVRILACVYVRMWVVWFFIHFEL